MAREIQRSVLPIPDQPSYGLVRFNGKINLVQNRHVQTVAKASASQRTE
jgi:hypothetical protein